MPETSKLSTDSSIISRLFAWSHERFPAAHGVLFLVLYAAGLLVGRALVTPSAVPIGSADFLGFFAVVCFFLMLRVFDEHKDYELDCLNHPHRVLQSGLITLGHLKVLGLVAVAIQLSVSLHLDGGFGPVTTVWLIVMGWSSLMAVEFFCGEWLEKRLVLYALSHMIVMPMALIWMAQMGAGSQTLPTAIAWLGAASFFSGASFEVTRKMKAPEDERETIDSYTKSLGLKTAPIVVLGLLLSSTVSLAFLLKIIFEGSLPLYWYGLLAAPLALAAFHILKFRSAPSAQTAKKCEDVVALAMLSGYGLLLVGLYVVKGFQWV